MAPCSSGLFGTIQAFQLTTQCILMKEERFRSMFAAFGTLTDCSLKFTKEGKFRKFGFVGFRSEEEAGTALKHFNKSFVDTARITVECCKPFGDATKAKAWSKHSRKSVSTEGKEPGQQKEAAAVKKEKKKKAITSTLGELKEDQDFKEFLAVHQNRAQVPTWANDTLTEPKKNKEQDEKKKKAATDYLNFDSDQSSEEEEEEESTERTGRETGLSDMDYLRSKVVSEREEESEEEDSAADRKLPPQADGAYESGDKGTAQTLTDKKKGKQNQTEPTTPYTVKLRGAPFNVKEQQVQEFLVPLKPVAIRIVRNVHGNKTGSIFVDLKSEDEVLKALQRNKDYLGGRYIEVFRAKAAPEGRPEKRGGEEKDWRRQLKEDEEEEEVSESGRLFVRNLPYTCSEEDISGLFSKYGPLSEVHFPIDSLTKKPKGFAFITFLIPEHAVKALAELDGHIFQVRRNGEVTESITRNGTVTESITRYTGTLRRNGMVTESITRYTGTLRRNGTVTESITRYAGTLRRNGTVTENITRYAGTLRRNGMVTESITISGYWKRPVPVCSKLISTLVFEIWGRMLHLLPSTIKKEKVEEGPSAPGASSYKKQKDSKDKASGASSHNWNTLFVGTSAVADAIAQKYNTTKSQVLDHEARGSVAVRMALGETQIVQETRQFLLDNKVSLDSFSQALGPRSGTVILVKNLPAGVQGPELEAVFAPFGSLGRVLLPPAGLTAIVEFLEPTEAKRAFTKLAYTKFQHVPLYLEWAPMDVFSGPLPNSVQKQEPLCSPALEVKETKPESSGEGGSEEEEEEEEEESQPGCTLFIKNLNFTTTEDTLRQTFSKCGALRSCSISKKKDRSGNMLSMGYGFVEFKKAESAQKALRQLQHCMVEEHQLELKLSERATKATVTSVRKKQQSKKQTSSKILVRNVPFQASVREVRELFRYAQLFITLLKEEQYYLYGGALSTPPLSSARIVQPARALWQLEVHHGICSPQTALKYSTEGLMWIQVHTFPNILCTQLFARFV
ncbi:putative RNA-binding protein 19 [Acipenser ruthenus]|uniref:Putative RNA-binding protein 19 n=1 Tax=Acipenser ruthenus TaxID=7906 RepID=A0A662YJH4_ACIRT|nr:putative RNA-binding protein 19 [Acipenser ruthenus]